MKILQLCHKPPFPPKDGGCIAMHNITCGLLRLGHDVKIITAFTHKHDLELDEMPADYQESTDIEGVFVDTKVNLVDAFSSLITQDSYNISRFFNADLDIRLNELLKRTKFDIIHLESLFMTPYIGTIRRRSKAPVVLRSHNLEYVIWERMAAGTKSTARRTYLKYLAKKLKAYELDVMNQVDGIAAISKGDHAKYEKLGCHKPLITLPFGIDTSQYDEPAAATPSSTVFHLGAMDWMPNQEALRWFLAEVWPGVVKQVPSAELHLAGRSLRNDFFSDLPQGVSIHGEVENAQQFMAEHSIMVVPLLSAGGIRVKIIEGMAAGKAIVTTGIGLEGIDAVSGEHLLVADTAKSFIKAICKLLQDPKEVARLGANAHQLALSEFDDQKITGRLVDFYDQLIKGE